MQLMGLAPSVEDLRDNPETQVDQHIKNMIMRHNSEPQRVNKGVEELMQELKSDMAAGKSYISQGADGRTTFEGSDYVRALAKKMFEGGMAARYRSGSTSPMLQSQKDETRLYLYLINTMREVLDSPELQKFQPSILNEMLNAQNTTAEQLEKSKVSANPMYKRIEEIGSQNLKNVLNHLIPM